MAKTARRVRRAPRSEVLDNPFDDMLLDDTKALFREAGFNVDDHEGPRTHGRNRGNGPGIFAPGDNIARRVELGRERAYAFEAVEFLTGRTAEEYLRLFLNYIRSAKRPIFEELWVIGEHVEREAASYSGRLNPNFRVMSIRDFRSILKAPPPSRPASRNGGKARTKIGKAVEANKAAINLAIGGLILQIDDKLEALRNDLRNDPDSIATRDARISDFERIRAELENIRIVVAAFMKGQAKEKEVVKSVTTFRNGIKNWWHKGHEAIINKTFDAGLFLSSVGVLTLFKADTKIGMAVAGTLIAGRSIAGGVKGLKKKLFDD
jgi:hypothetical protein